ncbi:MAG: 3-hydroxyacyl-CoA dehydrogenase family protein [candidate division NC10 bacterium]|nr:3-hydroxyacyl-CoA dehydrogenase family protein [candidate division NC10 bacterium]
MTHDRSAGKCPIAVIGAGTMGAGIAQIFAQAGHPVRLQARKRETLEAALQRIRVNQDELIRHELLSAVDAEAARGRITVTQALDEALAGAAFVSENIPELLPPKQALFAQMDRLTSPETILSTNTSSLPITQVARDTKHSERVVGFHWFNPPHLIPLVEVIRGEQTGDGAFDETYRLAKTIGKSPIRVHKDTPGFVGNRLQRALEREFFYLERIGTCSREDLEVALKQGLGYRWSVVGPFEHADLAGVETHSATVSFLFPLLSTDTEPPALFADLVAKGRLGAKTGAGVYEYGPGEVDRILARRNTMLIDFIKVLKKHPPLRALGPA